jgi:hypothetical protein
MIEKKIFRNNNKVKRLGNYNVIKFKKVCQIRK